MRLALEQVAAWRRLGHDLTVAVNISSQVLVDRSFTDHVVAALHGAGVPSARLKLEVTELWNRVLVVGLPGRSPGL